MTGLDLIKRYEGLKFKAYPDPSTGGRPYTIGYGSTRMANGQPVKFGDSVTAAEASKLLERDVTYVRTCIERDAVLGKLPQGCKEALLSLCYNIKGGVASFQKSQCYRAIRDRNVGDLYHNWDWGVYQKNVALGLARRRADEMKLFLDSWK